MNVNKIEPGKRYIVREKSPAASGFPAITRERAMTAIGHESTGTVLMEFEDPAFVPASAADAKGGPAEWGAKVITRSIPVRLGTLPKRRHVKPTDVLKEANAL